MEINLYTLKVFFLLIISISLLSCKSSKEKKLYPIAINNKMGFIDSVGNVLIECKYDYVGKFSEGLAIAVIDSNYGYIDMNGDYKIQPKFNLIKHIMWGSKDMYGIPEFSSNEKKNKFLSHLKSKPDTLFDYDIPKSWSFNEGLAPFYKNDKYGYINTDGKEVIKEKYAFASSFSQGVAAVKYNKSGKSFGDALYGYINKEDKFVIEPQYTNAADFSEGKAIVSIVYDYKDSTSPKNLSNIKFFVLNEKGNILFTPDVQAISNFKNGYASCFNLAYHSFYKAGSNYIDTTGKYYIPYDKGSFVRAYDVSNITDSVKYFNGKLFLVQNSSQKWGFLPENIGNLDKKSDEIFIYEQAFPFTENLSAVKINGKWGYINPNEKFIIKPIYTRARDFKDGLAYVEQIENGFKLVGYINRSGIMIWSTKSIIK